MNKGKIQNIARGLKGVSAFPKMPLPVFKSILKLAPHVVVELLITNKRKQFLLTWRQDAPFHGWHFPGGFLGYGESVERACQRVAKRELGIRLSGIKQIETLNYIRGEDPRAHLVALVCVAKPIGAPKSGKFFSSAPKERAPHVLPLLKVLRKHV
jgi:ADP-ribose pyrophosphatase YjhB (NUDIX family)